jgi:hypothetical protein
MNRQERRKAASLHRAGLRALKLRCAGCDRVGQAMTREHFFPSWLIEHADVRRDGIDWLGARGVSPDKATFPLCNDCNNAFANTLEGPVSTIFRSLDAGDPISDQEAELLVRWMWKFEGLQWSLYAASIQRYTDRYTLVERVTKPHAFAQIRHRLVLAIATCRANDPDFEDWPLGIDTPPGEDAITMSGVFRRAAIITSLADFADEIPEIYGKYLFGPAPQDRNAKVFSPLCAFLTADGVIAATKATAVRLSAAHRALGREMRAHGAGQSPAILPVRFRVELPPN